MNLYFVIRLLIDIFVTLILFRVLMFTHRYFKKERVKKAYLIYAPTIISLILIAQIWLFLAPKLLDTVRFFSSSPIYANVEVASRRSIPGAFTDTEDNVYYYNPLSLSVREGDVYMIRYLPNSRYLVRADSSDQTDNAVPDTSETPNTSEEIREEERQDGTENDATESGN